MEHCKRIHIKDTTELVEYGFMIDLKEKKAYLVGDEDNLTEIFLYKVFCSLIVYNLLKESDKSKDNGSDKRTIFIESERGDFLELPAEDVVLLRCQISSDLGPNNAFMLGSAEAIRTFSDKSNGLKSWMEMLNAAVQRIEELSSSKEAFVEYLSLLLSDYAKASCIESSKEYNAFCKALNISEYENTYKMHFEKGLEENRSAKEKLSISSIVEYLTDEDIKWMIGDIEEELLSDHEVPEMTDEELYEMELAQEANANASKPKNTRRNTSINEEETKTLSEMMFIDGIVAAFCDSEDSFKRIMNLCREEYINTEDITKDDCLFAKYLFVKDKKLHIALEFKKTGCDSLVKL